MAQQTKQPTRRDAALWTLAELGYQALGDSMGWLLLDGASMPAWHQQTPEVRDAVYDAQLAAQHALSLIG